MLSIASACRTETETPPATGEETEAVLEPRTLDSPSMQFLPRREEATGWRLVSDPAVYPVSILDRYLAGSADELRSYDLIDLTVGEYEAVAGDGFAFLEIFRFPDFVQAFGAFSEQRSTAGAMFETQNLGMSTDLATIIWRGPFMVRALGRGSDDATLRTLAETAVSGMPLAPGLPAAFRLLPVRNRIDWSERFQRDGALGQPYLANSFVADFRIDSQTVIGLVLPAPNPEAAALILETWRSFFETSGRLLDPVQNLGEDNFTGEEQFMGRTAAFRNDRFVVIFNGFVERSALVDMAVDSNARIVRAIEEARRQSGS